MLGQVIPKYASSLVCGFMGFLIISRAGLQARHPTLLYFFSFAHIGAPVLLPLLKAVLVYLKQDFTKNCSVSQRLKYFMSSTS